jgi:hypothetical protein
MEDGEEENLRLGWAISVRIPTKYLLFVYNNGFSDILKTIGEVLSNK